MAHALIVGAGAIGRGYLPWELSSFALTFLDSSDRLVSSLGAGGYSSFMAKSDGLEALVVDRAVFTANVSDLDLGGFDVAFVCVGPRNLSRLSPALGRLTCPVFSLENDSATVDELKRILGKEDIYFGVPDVITSSTASPESLSRDPNALHTEQGVLYLEDGPAVSPSLKAVLPNVHWCDKARMVREWDAKLFIHNTPHCIAAFFGHLHGCTYVHEALAIESVEMCLDGVIDEVLQTLKITTGHDHSFLEWYAAKELSRFRNTLLYDPVSRVAREPLRKMAPDGRLLGILRMALGAGIWPESLAAGFVAGLQYSAPHDQDARIMSCVEHSGVEAFLRFVLKVDPRSVEGQLIARAYASRRAPHG